MYAEKVTVTENALSGAGLHGYWWGLSWFRPTQILLELRGSPA